MQKVKISSAMARHPFHGCELGYIKNVCKGACCKSSTKGAIVHILEKEKSKFSKVGIDENNLLKTKNNKCPYQNEYGLCDTHKDKPFGCIASPFTLNKNNTLIIRNRYRLLKCYKDGNVPAYRAFYDSLKIIFGETKANIIKKHLDNGGGDMNVGLDDETIKDLKEKNVMSKA